jgi:hypothetical protein
LGWVMRRKNEREGGEARGGLRHVMTGHVTIELIIVAVGMRHAAFKRSGET